MRWFALVMMGLGLCAAPAVALASDGNKAAAEALFNEGRTLMGSGKYAEAIGKLKASQDLDPGLGTLLNLAECYERIGRSATAWAQYREIARPSSRLEGAGGPRRAKEQGARAEAVEARDQPPRTRGPRDAHHLA